MADETLLALYSTFQNTANLHEHEARAIDQWSEVVKLEGILLGLRAVAAAAWDEGWNQGFRDYQSRVNDGDGYDVITPTPNPYAAK